MRIIMCLCLCLLIGCGEEKETPAQKLARQKNETLSQVNVIADSLTNESGFTHKEVNEKDVWGNPIRVRYAKKEFFESLTVASNGPDGLAFTKDDIGAVLHYSVKGTTITENGAAALTKGLTRGIFEGMKK